MQVTQVYELLNTVTKEILGETAVVNEDLTNVVDIGNAIFDNNAMDAYVKSLLNHIGKVIFVNRKYQGGAPSVLMDGWEYGSVVEKITAELPTAIENDSWNLVDGQSYDQQVFYQPKVTAKFYNKKVTFEIRMSFAEKQVKQSFSSAAQLNGFFSMIYTAVEKAMTVRIDELIMRTINNFIGETFADQFPSGEGYDAGTGNRCVNVLKLYNDQFGTTLTPEEAIRDKEFIRYFAYLQTLYKSRLTKISKLFNIGGTDKFTPNSDLHIVTIENVMSAAKIYLQSDTYHDELVALSQSETVPFWQGSGEDYSWSNVSEINIKTASGKNVHATGILGVMFDRNALGVTNMDRRVTSAYNARAEFYTNFYKMDAGYFNDFNENFIVFYAA